jgi:hypothetical protein
MLMKQAVFAGIRPGSEPGLGLCSLVFATEHTKGAGVAAEQLFEDRGCGLMRMPPGLRAAEREAGVVRR